MRVGSSRRRGISALAVLIAVAILPAAWRLETANRSHAERGSGSHWTEALKKTVAEIILPLVGDERTTCAPGCREEVFRAVKRGASEATVCAAGRATRTWHAFPDGETVSYYTQQATGMVAARW